MFEANTRMSSINPIICTFGSLNDDMLCQILQFIGKKCYLSFGSIDKRCNQVFVSSQLPKETFRLGYVPLPIILSEDHNLRGVAKAVVLFNRNDALSMLIERQSKEKLLFICEEASREGRLDILSEIFNSSNKETSAFLTKYGETSCNIAAMCGELEILKFLNKQGCPLDENTCFSAASCGKLNVLKYLENFGCVLHEDIFYY